MRTNTLNILASAVCCASIAALVGVSPAAESQSSNVVIAKNAQADANGAKTGQQQGETEPQPPVAPELTHAMAGRADLDGNGEITVYDLALMLMGWGNCPTWTQECPGDINADGLVDEIDLMLMLDLLNLRTVPVLEVPIDSQSEAREKSE